MMTERLEGSKRLGYLPENGPLYPEETPLSILQFFADARGWPASTRTTGSTPSSRSAT